MKVHTLTINKSHVLAAAVAMGLALPAAAVGAGQPTRTKVPDSQFVATVPAGAVCPFEASGAPVVNNAYNLTYPLDANGDVRQITSGNVVERFTNDDTGKSIDVNISGPSVTVLHQDGSATITLEGPTFLVNVIPPVPGLVIVDGRTVLNQSPSGDLTLVSFNGTVTLDVCAALG
jgi:hypothetical protein